MSNYSDFFNTEVEEANITSDSGSFTGGGGGGSGSASVEQHAAVGVTQSGTTTATHSADPISSRVVQVLEFVDGESKINTTLDFDLADEGDFIQEDAANGTDFVDGTVTLHSLTTPTVSTDAVFDEASGGETLSNGGRDSTGSNWDPARCATYEIPTTGKHYFEIECLVKESNGSYFGIIDVNDTLTLTNGDYSLYTGYSTNAIYIAGAYNLLIDNSLASTLYEVGTIVGMVVDMDNNRLHFYRNNVYQGYYPIINKAYHVFASSYSGGKLRSNFNSSEQTYTPPLGANAGFQSGSYSYTPTDAGESPDAQIVISADGDDSSNNHELTHTGTATYISETPPIGKSLIDIKGSNNRLLIPASSDFTFGTGSYTCEAWCNFDTSVTALRRLFDHYHGEVASSWMLRHNSGTGFNLYTFDENAIRVSASINAVLTNGWHHVALEYDSNTQLETVYVNGVSVYQHSKVNNIVLGEQVRFGDVGEASFELCEIRLSNVARYSGDFTPHTEPHVSDANTVLLIHAEDANQGTNTFNDSSSSNHSVSSTGTSINTLVIPVGTGIIDFTKTSAIKTSAFQWAIADFTIECWVKYHNAPTGDEYLFSTEGFESGDWADIRVNSNGYADINLYTDGGNYTVGTGNGTITFGVWHHVALVRSGDTCKFYVDGVEKGTQAVSGTSFPSSKVLNVGGDYQVVPDAGIDGQICQFRVSDTARYTADFSGNLQTTTHVSDGSTVLLIHGDGITKSLYDITTAGDPQLKAGKFEEAFYFDGVGDSVSVEHSSDFNLGHNSNPWTIDFWMKRGAVDSDTPVAHRSGETGWRVHLYSTSAINFYSTYLGVGISVASSDLVLDTWQHLAVVNDGSNFTIYVDGVSQGTSTSITVADVTAPLEIGGDQGSNMFNGYIDEFRLTNGTALWTSDFTPPNAAHSNVPNPTDGSAYVTTSDNNQLNFSVLKIDSVTSCTIAHTTPAGTTLKALASFDGRSTWRKYNAGWTTVSGMDFTGATVSGLEAGISGLTTSGIATVDFAFELDTTDSTASPAVDLITLNYDENGSYILSSDGDYSVSYASSTTTKVTKNSVGSKNIKVNIIT